MNKSDYIKAQDRLDRYHRAWELVQEQADDDGLWFLTEDITVGYLQQELQRLHAIIEDDKFMEAVATSPGKDKTNEMS